MLASPALAASGPNAFTVGVPVILAAHEHATPVPSAAKIERARKAHAARVSLTATPATLPAAGGRLHLSAHVRRATSCRFFSANAFRKLPHTERCASGVASVTIRVPTNKTSAARVYVVYLTARGAHGASHTVRDVIVERARATTRAVSVTVSGNAANAAAAIDTQLTSSNAPAAAPLITTQPASQSVSAGAFVTLAAAASGTPTPSVQWQLSTDGGTTWAATANPFIATANENGYQYRAVFTNTAGSATTNAVALTVVPASTTNFSGYIAYAASGQNFTAVSASWTVPTVTCQPGQTSWAAQWPGIGDATSVQQDGTETDCFNGSPNYWAWYEMYGDNAVNNGYAVPLQDASYPVAAGDAMSGSVALSGSTWVLTLSDATQNWTFQAQFASPTPQLSQGSAEWMVEDPDGCTPQCQPLSQFSPVQFTAAAAAVNGQSEPISNFPLTAVQIDQNSTPLATPGLLTADGFTDTWLAG